MPGLLIVAWPVIAETPNGTNRDNGNDDQECDAHQSCGRCGYGRKGGKDGQLARCVVHGEYVHDGHDRRERRQDVRLCSVAGSNPRGFASQTPQRGVSSDASDSSVGIKSARPAFLGRLLMPTRGERGEVSGRWSR